MARGGQKRVATGLRTCLGCRTVRPKGELQRVVLGPDGTIRAQARVPLPGRGAYFCPTVACATRGARHLPHAWRRDVEVTAAALWAAVQAARPDPPGSSRVDPSGMKV